jgi:hypothetical protein
MNYITLSVTSHCLLVYIDFIGGEKLLQYQYDWLLRWFNYWTETFPDRDYLFGFIELCMCLQRLPWTAHNLLLTLPIIPMGPVIVLFHHFSMFIYLCWRCSLSYKTFIWLLPKRKRKKMKKLYGYHDFFLILKILCYCLFSVLWLKDSTSAFRFCTGMIIKKSAKD